jgi:hypothetical protein
MLVVTQIDKKFPAFYLSRNFITVFTRAHHYSLSSAQMTPAHSFPNYLSKIHSYIPTYG